MCRILYDLDRILYDFLLRYDFSLLFASPDNLIPGMQAFGCNLTELLLEGKQKLNAPGENKAAYEQIVRLAILPITIRCHFHDLTEITLSIAFLCRIIL